jgi:hypothetical protein
MAKVAAQNRRRVFSPDYRELGDAE